MAISPLQSPWRAADREAIRAYAGMTVTLAAMEQLVSAMNTVAQLSPDTVRQCQIWISEVRSLESDYAQQVANGTAHLSSARTYEGLRPGEAPSREDMLRKADVLEYDTDTLYKIRIEAGDGPLATGTGSIRERIADLQDRVLSAVGLSRESSTLLRS